MLKKRVIGWYPWHSSALRASELHNANLHRCRGRTYVRAHKISGFELVEVREVE